MRTHLSNAAYGVVDYLAYPAAMLVAAPVVLHHLGVAQYGVWVVATAVASTGAIVASGFGDANIQYVASVRAQGNADAMRCAVQSMVGINLLLGGVFAMTAWMLAPLLARHLAPSDLSLQMACLWSLRIAGMLILVRAVESVCISTHRAFELYGAAVRTSILARLLAQAAAIVLAVRGLGLIGIMIATAFFLVAGTAVQLVRLRRHLKGISLLPAFDREATTALLGFGVFSWLQAVSSVVFNQADRLVLGVSLGATAVTAYAFCVQMAQPIYGIAASGLHFLFPYLSGRQATAPARYLRRPILIAFAWNLFFVAFATALVLLFGRQVLHLWVGGAIARSSESVLAPVVWSFALLGLNVTGYYALLAFGRVRTVTWLSLAGGLAMLLMMGWLSPREGVFGIAAARLSYGGLTLSLYYPLFRLLWKAPDASGALPVCEEA
jgi:O-antigen/teichoic acid export membrane protein